MHRPDPTRSPRSSLISTRSSAERVSFDREEESEQHIVFAFSGREGASRYRFSSTRTAMHLPRMHRGPRAQRPAPWTPEGLLDRGLAGRSEHHRWIPFAVGLQMAGESIKDIQELAGHKTVAISVRYAHLSPDHKRSVMNLSRRASEGVK